MSDREIRKIRWATDEGKFVNLLVREKGRQIEDGIEGIVFAWLRPKALIEVGELWAPVDQSCGRGER
jgi:hypothetical protein